MRKEEWELTSRALLEGTRSLFELIGEPLEFVGRVEMPASWSRVAIVGFAGEAFGGMLAVSIDATAIARTAPSPDHDDWHCELANLILGRFKREMLMLGVEIHLSTPMLVVGEGVSLDTSAVSAVVHRFKTSHDESLYIVLDAVAEKSVHLCPIETAPPMSGEIVLF